MIKVKIDTATTKKLVDNLKAAKKEMLTAINDSMIDVKDAVNEEFTRNMDQLVYEEYDPEFYERTYHLRGEYGAKQELMEANGLNKSYVFEINENSVAPDGDKWGEKADRVESGQLKGNVPLRPFINETQEALEWQLKRNSNSLLRRIDGIIDRRFKG